MNDLSKWNQKGFTLVEIAIVLVIVGLVLGTGFSTLGAYLDNAKQSRTIGSLQTTKQAMLNYVMVNRHMPCPDTDNDGNENREATFECSSSKGTVPFNSIGLGVGVTRDQYNNVFLYGINTDSTVAANIINAANSASYFNNQSAPVFTLSTPPTVAAPNVLESYTVCKEGSTACNNTPSNIEVNSIPAVIVAMNENGGATTLAACNSEIGREAENCDNDLFLWKNVFQNDGSYDDQMVSISGYEIKEQVLDLLNNITLTINNSSTSFAGYDTIYLRNVDDSNDMNTTDREDNNFYIGAERNSDGSVDTSDAAEDGNLSVSVGFGSGSDTLYVEGDVYNENGNYTSTGLSFASGSDQFILEGDLKGSLDLGSDDDKATIYGDIYADITGGSGDDKLVFYADLKDGAEIIMTNTTGNDSEPDVDVVEFDTRDVADDEVNRYDNNGDGPFYLGGSIDLNRDSDTFRIWGTNFTVGTSALIDAGDGNDTLELRGITEAAFYTLMNDNDSTDDSGSLRNFEVVSVIN